MKKLNVLHIGIGRWGHNIFNTLKRMNINLYVADIDPKTLDRHRLDFVQLGIEETTDYNNFLDKVSAVVISTPASTHYKIAKRCLEAGKDVFCEKPLTLDSYEAEELIALAKKKNRILAVGYKFLFNPIVSTIKNKLSKVGIPEFIDAKFTMLKPVREDDGVKGTYACHFLAVIFHLLGAKDWKLVNRETINLFLHREDFEDVSIINMFNTKTQTLVNLVVTWLTPSANIQTMRISCPKGGIQASFIKDKSLIQTVDVDYTHHNDKGQVVPGNVEHIEYSQDPLLNELKAFCSACRTRKKPINSADLLELAIQKVIR